MQYTWDQISPPSPSPRLRVAMRGDQRVIARVGVTLSCSQRVGRSWVFCMSPLPEQRLLPRDNVALPGLSSWRLQGRLFQMEGEIDGAGQGDYHSSLFKAPGQTRQQRPVSITSGSRTFASGLPLGQGSPMQPSFAVGGSTRELAAHLMLQCACNEPCRVTHTPPLRCASLQRACRREAATCSEGSAATRSLFFPCRASSSGQPMTSRPVSKQGSGPPYMPVWAPGALSGIEPPFPPVPGLGGRLSEDSRPPVAGPGGRTTPPHRGPRAPPPRIASGLGASTASRRKIETGEFW